MKILPLSLKLEKGVNKYELAIDNTSEDEKVLLFRIRRSEHKVLTFSPKKGYVLPREKKLISIYILDDNFHKTKLLVKFVPLNKEEVTQDFDETWRKGEESRKVISIVNPANLGQDLLSEMSVSELPSVYDSVYDSASTFTHNSVPAPQEQLVQLVSHIVKTLQTKTDVRSEEGVKKLLEEEAGGELAALLLPLLKGAQAVQSLGDKVEEKDQDKPEKGFNEPEIGLKREDERIEVEYSDELVHSHSSLTPLPTSHPNLHKPPVTLEVYGNNDHQPLPAHIIRQLIEDRVCECIHTRTHIHALDISRTPLMEMKETIGDIFRMEEGEGEVFTEQEFMQKELYTLRLNYLKDHMKAISITYTQLHTLDVPTLNSFTTLTHLTLAHNKLKAIPTETHLYLPCLTYLDLSHNMLRSIHNIELCVHMQTLYVQGNRLESFEHSVNVLVALQNSIVELDMSQNPVCQHASYVDEVLATLPHLTHFDSLAIASLSASYSAKNKSSMGSNLPSFPCEDARESVGGEFERRVRRALQMKNVQKIRGSGKVGGGGVIKENWETNLRGERRDVFDVDRSDARGSPSSQTPPSAFKQHSYYVTVPNPTSTFNPTASGNGSGGNLMNSARREAGKSPAPNTASPSFRQQTSSSVQRRKSQTPSLLAHWADHKEAKPKARGRRSSLLNLTDSAKIRSSAFGISSSVSPSRTGGGYVSDTSLNTSRGVWEAKLRAEHFEEMQEVERYGIWHPRYRVPSPVFGYSKPFVKRQQPHLKVYAPLFDKTVQRIRDGFTKLPTRGTFPRASKGLPAQFYPMDYTEIEAIRRQGYFHETIGDIQKGGYRDLQENKMGSSVHNSSLFPPSAAVVSPSGSVSLSPTKRGRRGSVGQHMSRQYKSSVGGGGDDGDGLAMFNLTGSFSMGGGESAGNDEGSRGGRAQSAPPAVRSTSLANLFPGLGGDGEGGDVSAIMPSAGMPSSSAPQPSFSQYASLYEAGGEAALGTVKEAIKKDVSEKVINKDSGKVGSDEEEMASYLQWLESQYAPTGNGNNNNLHLSFMQPDNGYAGEERERRNSF